jgi:hypothetical protein
MDSKSLSRGLVCPVLGSLPKADWLWMPSHHPATASYVVETGERASYWGDRVQSEWPLAESSWSGLTFAIRTRDFLDSFNEAA